LANKSNLTLEQKFEAFYANSLGKSRQDIGEKIGKSGRQVDRIVEALTKAFQNNPALLTKYEQWKAESKEGKSKPKVYYQEILDEKTGKKVLVSDYEIVQKWINSQELGNAKMILQYQERFWGMTGKKEPSSWTMDDWIAFKKTYAESGFDYRMQGSKKTKHYLLSDNCQFQYMVALGYVAPAIKQTDNRTKKIKQSLKKNRIKVRIYMEEFSACIRSQEVPYLSKLVHLFHVTTGTREGRNLNKNSSLLGCKWENVDWEKKTIDIFESKNQCMYRNIPLDLFPQFDLVSMLKEYSQGKTEGRIFDFDGTKLSQLYEPISKFYVDTYGAQRIKVKSFRPHYSRKVHANILGNDMKIPLEIVAGGEVQAGGQAEGYCGCGWEDLGTLKSYYFEFRQSRIDEVIARGRARLRGEAVAEEEDLK
jgi:hypothetical protein